MSSRRPAVMLGMALVAAACVHTNATRLGTAPARPPVHADSVAVYRTAAQVPGKYEEIALLNSAGEASWTSEAKMFNSMRKKAGEMGANAIVLDALSEPGAGAKVAAAVLGVGAERKGRAIAVYVVPAAPAASGASAALAADSAAARADSATTPTPTPTPTP
jgi:hypothetical protein